MKYIVVILLLLVSCKQYSEIKALEHIQTELAKCTGDKAGEKKGTFKTSIGEYLKGESANLDSIKTEVISTCGTAGTGAGG